jgi:plastocyanin
VKRSLILLAVATLLAGCSSGGSKAPDSGSVTTQGSPDAQTATVGMTDKLRFDPGTVDAKVGTVTLDVKNEGGVPHNLTFDDTSLGKTRTVSGHASQPLKLVFDKAGTFTFQCTFHPGMTGKVVVS